MSTDGDNQRCRADLGWLSGQLSWQRFWRYEEATCRRASVQLHSVAVGTLPAGPRTWASAGLVREVLQASVGPCMVYSQDEEGRQLAGCDELRSRLARPPGAAGEGQRVVKQVLQKGRWHRQVGRQAGRQAGTSGCAGDVQLERALPKGHTGIDARNRDTAHAWVAGDTAGTTAAACAGSSPSWRHIGTAACLAVI